MNINYTYRGSILDTDQPNIWTKFKTDILAQCKNRRRHLKWKSGDIWSRKNKIPWQPENAIWQLHKSDNYTNTNMNYFSKSWRAHKCEQKMNKYVYYAEKT